MPTEQETAFIQEVLARNLVTAYQIDQTYKTFETLKGQGLSIQLHQVFVQLRYLNPGQVQEILAKVRPVPRPGPSAAAPVPLPQTLELSGAAPAAASPPAGGPARSGPPAGAAARTPATPPAPAVFIPPRRSYRLIVSAVSVSLFAIFTVAAIFAITKYRALQQSSDPYGSSKVTSTPGGPEVRLPETTTVPAVKTPEAVFPEFKNKFLSFLDGHRYQDALAFLDAAPEAVKNEVGLEGVQALRDMVPEKAQAYFKRQKAAIEELKPVEKFDEALQIVAEIEGTGYAEFQAEAKTLREALETEKKRADLLKRVDAYGRARRRLDPLLEGRYFGKASQAIDELVTEPGMEILKDDLLETKKEFDQVRQVLRQASEAAKEKIGTSIFVGGKAQKLLNVQNGNLTLELGTKVVTLSEDKFSVGDVERFLRPGDKTDAATLYALGLLSLYEGNASKAEGWFRRLDENHPGLKRQQEHRRLERESDAVETFKELRAAVDRRQPEMIVDLARRLRAQHEASELLKAYDAWITETVQKAEREIEANKSQAKPESKAGTKPGSKTSSKPQK